MFKIPSLRGLLMLEAVARHGTFRGAAQELNTTPSAISHRIADLEQALGGPLFNRSGRSVEITAAGREYAREIRSALGLIATSGERFTEGTHAVPIRIALHPPFAHNWLAPRLERLANSFPNHNFEFIYVDRPSEAFGDEVDFAIDWGAEKTSLEKGGDVLVPRVVTLVATPSYLSDKQSVVNDAGITSLRLLTNTQSLHEVSQWLALLERDTTEFQSAFRFSSSALLLAAIRNGFGAGLVCRNLVAEDITSGSLVAPFRKHLDTGDCYYIMKMPRMQDEKLGEKLRGWFIQEAGRVRRSVPES